MYIASLIHNNVHSVVPATGKSETNILHVQQTKTLGPVLVLCWPPSSKLARHYTNTVLKCLRLMYTARVI